jgi:hypothetical protein
VRKFVYEAPVLESKEQMISDAVDAFIAGFAHVFGAKEEARKVAVKVMV